MVFLETLKTLWFLCDHGNPNENAHAAAFAPAVACENAPVAAANWERIFRSEIGLIDSWRSLLTGSFENYKNDKANKSKPRRFGIFKRACSLDLQAGAVKRLASSQHIH